jgi:hypothetical protein
VATGPSPPLPRGREAVAAAAHVPPDCTTCGACCFSTQADYIELFEVDVGRLDAAALELTRRIGERRFMRFEAGHCVALETSSGARCRIYAQRPDACRWLPQGSGACREQIAQKREIALLSIRLPRAEAPR